MSSSAPVSSCFPMWGSKGWRVCSAIIAILILAYGTYSALSDILNGYVIWWYNLSFVLFAFAILGLVLLVREGFIALHNVADFGLHPRRAGDGSNMQDAQATENLESEELSRSPEDNA